MRRWWRTISSARRRPAAERRTPRWRSYSTRGFCAAASFCSMLVMEAGATLEALGQRGRADAAAFRSAQGKDGLQIVIDGLAALVDAGAWTVRHGAGLAAGGRSGFRGGPRVLGMAGLRVSPQICFCGDSWHRRRLRRAQCAVRVQYPTGSTSRSGYRCGTSFERNPVTYDVAKGYQDPAERRMRQYSNGNAGSWRAVQVRDRVRPPTESMAIIEVPPPQSAPPEPPAGPKFRRKSSTRYEGMEADELLHLIDNLEDERSRARVREGIYISLLAHVLIFLWILFGPRYILH